MKSQNSPHDDGEDEALLDRVTTLSTLLTNVGELLNRYPAYILLPGPEIDPNLLILLALALLLRYVSENRKGRSAE